MNKLVLFIVMLTLNASNALGATSTEGYCLALGKVGEVTAKLADEGMTEEDTIQLIVKDAKYKDAAILVAKYIYTMRPTPADARKIIYLKCRSGDLAP